MTRIFSILCTLVFALSFAGCRSGSESTKLTEELESLQNLKKDVVLELSTTNMTAETIEVRVKLQNPSHQKLESVRSWVSFPKDILEGTTLSFPEAEAIGLIAPGENEFDNETGLAKIGFSFAADGELPESFTVAVLTFKRLKNESAPLTFFDVRNEGHTQVLVKQEEKLRNVLQDHASVPSVVPDYEA